MELKIQFLSCTSEISRAHVVSGYGSAQRLLWDIIVLGNENQSLHSEKCTRNKYSVLYLGAFSWGWNEELLFRCV